MAALTLLYFAWVRERVGRGEERVERPVAGTSIAALLDTLATQSEGHAAAFADRTRLRAALDQKFVPLDTQIGGAKELALFPPVTGG
ncbi:MAG: MoaD/ThiS family protein [Sphingobium sp.]|nr:MoaD/ThiS family protein [Sphingobium sp.]